MVLCLVGMRSAFILPALRIPFGSVGSLLLILLCPFSHVLVMWGFFENRRTKDTDAAGLQPMRAADERRG
jgi:hypothetical protein